ncbi:MAG: hypothetical protein ACPGPS_01135, partial [Rubripirellula sp.]
SLRVVKPRGSVIRRLPESAPDSRSHSDTQTANQESRGHSRRNKTDIWSLTNGKVKRVFQAQTQSRQQQQKPEASPSHAALEC